MGKLVNTRKGEDLILVETDNTSLQNTNQTLLTYSLIQMIQCIK